MLKVIVKYEKTQYMKYLGHLEMVRIIERVLRRIDLPLDYSKGFNPKPQISFAAPLSVGVSSIGEYFEVKVTKEFDLKKITEIDPSFLPKGLKFVDAVFSTNKKSIMAIVKSASYILKVETNKDLDENEVRSKLDEFLSQDEILWKKIRKRKKPINKNIVNLINKIYLLNTANNELIFRTEVKTGSSGNLKPEIAIQKFIEFSNIELKDDFIDIQRLNIYKNEDSKEVPII